MWNDRFGGEEESALMEDCIFERHELGSGLELIGIAYALLFGDS